MRRSRFPTFDALAISQFEIHYAEHLPTPALAPYVRCIWRLRAPAGVMTAPEPVIPDGRVELILNFADPFVRHVDGRVEAQSSAIVAGQITRATTIAATGRVDVWGIRFHPWGAAPFLGASGDELRDRFFTGEELCASITHAMPRIAECEGDAPQLDAIMRTLNSRLARARQVGDVAHRLTSLSTQSHEPLTTRALAAHVGLSARRVQSIFRNDVGLSPKQLLRISRLQRALALHRSNGTLSWSAIAARAGYYDHAHFTHDCNDIAGAAPSQLFGVDAGLTETFLNDAH
jgi:AraC-like DNA-binding protein